MRPPALGTFEGTDAADFKLKIFGKGGRWRNAILIEIHQTNSLDKMTQGHPAIREPFAQIIIVASEHAYPGLAPAAGMPFLFGARRRVTTGFDDGGLRE
jgi:hypothetical protein